MSHTHAFAQVTRPPPVLGEHTDEVLLDDLGYSKERIAELRKMGAIGA